MYSPEGTSLHPALEEPRKFLLYKQENDGNKKLYNFGLQGDGICAVQAHSLLLNCLWLPQFVMAVERGRSGHYTEGIWRRGNPNSDSQGFPRKTLILNFDWGTLLCESRHWSMFDNRM